MPMKLGAVLLEYQDNLTVCTRLYLKGLHSEHLEEEILNLRNTLLKVCNEDFLCYCIKVCIKVNES